MRNILWKKADDLKNLNEIYDTCIKLDGSRCDRDKEITTGWCYHRGECHVRVEKFASGKLYLVPFCECKGSESGRFCEYHRDSSCDPTAVEKQRGVTKENRCTSLRNGICIAPEGIALCEYV
ncbi:hypothetical protein OSTOST_09157, partial [Ostertagia ostertagi]